MRIWKTSLWKEQHRRKHGDSHHFFKLIRGTNTKRRAVLLHDGDNLLSLVEQAEKLAKGYEERDAARTASAPDSGESSATAGDECTIFFTYRQQKSALRRTKGGKAAGAESCEEKANIPPEQTGFRPYLFCDHRHARIFTSPTRWETT